METNQSLILVRWTEVFSTEKKGNGYQTPLSKFTPSNREEDLIQGDNENVNHI